MSNRRNTGKEFFNYWKENIKASKDSFDIIILIVIAVLCIIAAICRYGNFSNPIEEFITEAKLEKLAESGAGLFFSIWCFLWLPFRRHEAMNNTYSKQLEAQMSESNRRIAEFENLIKQKNNVEAEATLRRFEKDLLGDLLNKLEERIRFVERMTSTEFRNSLRDGKDLESLNLVSSIGCFIEKHIGSGEAAAYRSLSGIQLTEFHIPLSESGMLVALEEARRKQIRMVEHLNHWSKQLKQLIERYG